MWSGGTFLNYNEVATLLILIFNDVDLKVDYSNSLEPLDSLCNSLSSIDMETYIDRLYETATNIAKMNTKLGALL